VVDGLDVVSVGIEHERGVLVVAGVALPGAVVTPVGYDRGRMEGIHLIRARRGEGDVRGGVRRPGEAERKRLVVLPPSPAPKPRDSSLS
jgi:hypothetical protein